MGCRVGITTRLADRKKEWEREYPRMRNWQQYGPFKNRKEAQEWEDRQTCDKSGGGADPDTPGAKWYGYRFEF